MMYKAFVSSTFEDLKGHRSHVIRALSKAGFFVDPMEDWTAATDEPKRFSQARVQGCNLCILLVAFRRGHVPEGEELSITQLEYKAAMALGLDVLVFMLDEQAPWPRRFDELDKDPGIRRWRADLMEHRGVGFFSLNPESIEIASALTRWLAEQAIRQQRPASTIERGRRTFQRCDEVDTPAVEGTLGRPSALEFSPCCNAILDFYDKYTLKVRHRGATGGTFRYHAHSEWQSGNQFDISVQGEINGEYLTVEIPYTNRSGLSDHIFWFVDLVNANGITTPPQMVFIVRKK